MTTDIPKISILIVVWNEKEFLDKFFDCIQNQTFSDYEIICINNGSTDGSWEKIREWQKAFGLEKFKALENETNIGLTKALNLALKEARGKYVARIDPDDFWEKEKLEKQINFLENNPDHGIVGCNHINVYKNNENKKYGQLTFQLFAGHDFVGNIAYSFKRSVRRHGLYGDKAAGKARSA